jgi:hypothetical protein
MATNEEILSLTARNTDEDDQHGGSAAEDEEEDTTGDDGHPVWKETRRDEDGKVIVIRFERITN